MSSHHESTVIDDGSGKKSLGAYIIGFILCVILTVIPFLLVGKRLMSADSLFGALGIFAVLQLLVQVVFFLRLNTSRKGRWNLMPFLFAIVIVLVLVIGSFWIMYNLNYNMVH